MSDISKALSEVNTILEYSSIDIKNKIPSQFSEIIKKYQDKIYKIKIDKNKNLNEQNLLPETREILSLIYRDYLCTDEFERKKLIENNKEKIDKINNQYDIEKVFKKRKNSIEMSKEQYPTIIRKEKWYDKVLKFFRGIFKKS